MVATSSEARRLVLGVQCTDSRIVGQPDLLKEIEEAVAAIRSCRGPTFIQPMATRLDLTAAGVDVYCRSACGFELHFSNFTPPIALPPSQIFSGQSRCLLRSNIILFIALFLLSAFPSSSYGRHKIVCSQPSQYSTPTTSSSLGPRGSCSSSISRPSRNIGYLSPQNGVCQYIPSRLLPFLQSSRNHEDVREGQIVMGWCEQTWGEGRLRARWGKGLSGFPELS